MPRVVAVPVPPVARELAGLDRVDYADAFAVDVTLERSPREWVELSAAALPALFGAVRVVHRALGLPLAPAGAGDHPIGWDVLRDEPAAAVLGNDGAFGTPRIVGLARPGQLVLATLIRLNGRGRPIWAATAPLHRAVARYVLGRMPSFAAAPAAI